MTDKFFPDDDVAFASIQNMMFKHREIRDWSKLHPAVHWAVCQMDWSQIRNSSDRVKRKVFDRAWQEVKRRRSEGLGFPAAPGIPTKTKPAQAANEAIAIPALLNLKKILG